MPFCQHCGCKLEDTARFCPFCGQAVASDKETPASLEERIKGFLQITPEMEQEEMEILLKDFIEKEEDIK